MSEPAVDFGTGLRAHLGLEQARLELLAEPETAPAEVVSETPAAAAGSPESAALDALAELVERERELALREAALAGRAGTVLAAAQALYDEVAGRGPSPDDDELARMRRRKSVA